MRKILLLGLLALVFTVLSTTLQAGSEDAELYCAVFKDKDHPEYNPDHRPFYGLCNAYWTETDEALRIEILAAFEAKAGLDGPSMPGLDINPPQPTCPCWGNTDLIATGSLCFSGGFANVTNEPYTGYASFQYGSVTFQQVSGGTCFFVDGPNSVNRDESTNPGEQSQCAIDIAAIIGGRAPDCP